MGAALLDALAEEALTEGEGDPLVDEQALEAGRVVGKGFK